MPLIRLAEIAPRGDDDDAGRGRHSFFRDANEIPRTTVPRDLIKAYEKAL